MDESLMFTAIAMAYATDPDYSIKSLLCLEYAGKWESDELIQLDNAIANYTNGKCSAYSTPRRTITYIMEEIKK